MRAPATWPILATAAVLAAGGVHLSRSDLAAAEPKRTAWNRAALPAHVRDRVHLTTREVPRFPNEDARLAKPKGWPASMTIGGVPCALRIHAWDGDHAIALASLDDAKKGMRLLLFYDHHQEGWNTSSAGWGPRYTWNEKGKLTERIWYEPDSAKLVTHDYTYYRSGDLLGYSWRSEPRSHTPRSSKPYEFLSEFFDRDGRLIALAYERMKPGSRDSAYAWKGSLVSYVQFRRNAHKLYAAAHPGDDD